MGQINIILKVQEVKVINLDTRGMTFVGYCVCGYGIAAILATILGPILKQDEVIIMHSGD